MINTKYIRYKMIEKDFSIIQLSKEIDINVNTISRWLNGNNLNNIEKFIEMMIILDIDVNELKIADK